MIEKVITAYFCEHCNKLYQRKNACVKHEKYCRKNPANMHKCWSCDHLEYTKAEYDEYGVTPASFFCKKRDVEMWSYIAERRNIQHEAEERMPLECDDFEMEGWWHEIKIYDDYVE